MSENLALKYNQELRGIYDQIPRVSTQTEVSPALLDLIGSFLSQGQQGELRIANIYTAESLRAQQEEILRRGDSAFYLSLAPRHQRLLRDHSFLTLPAIEVADLQFADDFVYGRRVHDPIHTATQVRFASDILLDINNPQSQGVFNEKLVTEIERTIYGAYMDWVEIREFAIGGMEDELNLLNSWKLAFMDRYGSTPFPNLDK